MPKIVTRLSGEDRIQTSFIDGNISNLQNLIDGINTVLSSSPELLTAKLSFDLLDALTAATIVLDVTWENILNNTVEVNGPNIAVTTDDVLVFLPTGKSAPGDNSFFINPEDLSGGTF